MTRPSPGCRHEFRRDRCAPCPARRTDNGLESTFEKNIWHVHLKPTKRNGLTKESAVDALQVRSADTSRFEEKLGRTRATELEEIITAVAVVIEYR